MGYHQSWWVAQSGMNLTQRKHFALLKTIAERNGVSTLSMGMSDDFETAISFGANSVRIGSAIFGQRES